MVIPARGGSPAAPRGWEHRFSQPQPSGSISPSFQRLGNAGKLQREGSLPLAVPCSAPQSSEAAWFSASPRWPAAPRAGMASPPAPHRLKTLQAPNQQPFPSRKEGKTIPGPGNPLAHPPPSHGQQSRECGASAGSAPGTAPAPGTLLLARLGCVPGTGAGCQDTPCAHPGTGHSRDTGGTFPGEPPGRAQRRGISALTHFVSASHFFFFFFPLRFHLTPERV